MIPGVRNSFFAQAIYNPFVAGQLAWNFGNGFSASYLAGAYIGISNAEHFGNAVNRATLPPAVGLRLAWRRLEFTANLIVGLVGNQRPATALRRTSAAADCFNYDLALTHTFGKWEVGMVAYGSTDFGDD